MSDAAKHNFEAKLVEIEEIRANLPPD
jgi:hypothetical protein